MAKPQIIGFTEDFNASPIVLYSLPLMAAWS